MPASLVAVYANFAVQAALSLLLAGVLLALHRHYRQRYLVDWALAGAGTGLYFIGAIVALVFAETSRANGSLWLLVSFVEFLAINWAAGFLFLGAWRVARRREGKLPAAPWLFTALALVAVGVVLVDGLGAGRDLRVFARQGIRALITAAAYLGAAWILLRSPSWRQRRGLVIVSVLFAIYGLAQLHNAVFALPGMPSPPYSYYLGYLNIVLAAATGFGMVVGMLEQERDRARDAADQIEQMAYHDGLTGLPNRRLFTDRLTLSLAQAQRAEKRVAVVLVNIDRFKVVNTALGRGGGDELLNAVAGRIQRAVREGDTVARVAADEFAVLLTVIDRADDATLVASALREDLRRPFVVQRQEVFVSASFGISAYPADAGDAADLLRCADVALSHAKEAGPETIRSFAPAMNTRASERLDLEAGLHRALSAGEFVLHYQPVVDLGDGRVRKVEALVRWRHPQRGLLQPAAFLEPAETLGMSDALDLWVVHQACEQVQRWRASGFHDLAIAVNMSARALQQPGLVPLLAGELRATGLEPGALELEITETIAMQNPAESASVLRGLHELGVRVGIDDFGTGHSSLSYLRTLAVDYLKIDQSFVHDMPMSSEASAVTAAIIALAHSLRIGVVAEGVETDEQYRMLQELQCDQVQGFLFSRPLEAEACLPYLAARRVSGPRRRSDPLRRRERATPI